MKYCGNCGKELQENEICSCQKNESNDSKKSNKNLYIAAISTVTLLIVAVIFSNVMFGGYKRPINDFMNGIQDFDENRFLGAFPIEVADDLEDMFDDSDYEIDDIISEILLELEDEYGKNIKLKVSVDNKKELAFRDIKDYEEGYDVEIKKGYKVRCEITIKSNHVKETEKGYFYVAKIKGQGWKIIDFDVFDNLPIFS